MGFSFTEWRTGTWISVTPYIVYRSQWSAGTCTRLSGCIKMKAAVEAAAQLDLNPFQSPFTRTEELCCVSPPPHSGIEDALALINISICCHESQAPLEYERSDAG